VPRDPFSGEAGWAAATIADGTVAVLEICMPHMEGEHEIQARRLWDGNSTVQILEADEEAGVMLIARCEPGTGVWSVARLVL
jgi:streptomycin 6-kinase